MRFIIATYQYWKSFISCKPDYLLSNTHPARPAVIVLLLLTTACASPGDRAVTLYGGRYTDNSLPEEIIILKPIHYEDSWIAVGAYSEVFSKPTDSRHWAYEGHVVKHSGDQDHWEYNALVLHRWKDFTWSHPIRTSAAIGNGLSWATEVPALEESSRTNKNATQLLYYVLLELTLGLPHLEGIDLVGRIHHRSGALGLFDGVHGGSNIISLGFRFEF